MNKFGEKVSFIWGVTDLLRDSFKRAKYPDVILPRALWKKYDLVQDEELPAFDTCYCEVCRKAFRDEHGEDPLALPDPPASEAWRKFRLDRLTRFLCAHFRRRA